MPLHRLNIPTTSLISTLTVLKKPWTGRTFSMNKLLLTCYCLLDMRLELDVWINGVCHSDLHSFLSNH